MRHSGITVVRPFVLLLVGSCFSSPVCIIVTKSATSEDRTHDLKIMRLIRCRLRHCRCLLCGESVKILEPCTLMRHSGVTMLSGYILCCAAFGRLWFFASNMYYRDKKCDKWGSNSQLHDYEAYALPTAPLSLPSLWCISEVLEPCTLMRHSGITLLSSYLLCCFWLALVFSLQPVLLWQKLRQVRIELTTLRLWDLRAADCAIDAVSVKVHQWSYWSLVRWCGIPE